jgi:hypothetical protein
MWPSICQKRGSKIVFGLTAGIFLALVYACICWERKPAVYAISPALVAAGPKPSYDPKPLQDILFLIDRAPSLTKDSLSDALAELDGKYDFGKRGFYRYPFAKMIVQPFKFSAPGKAPVTYELDVQTLDYIANDVFTARLGPGHLANYGYYQFDDFSGTTIMLFQYKVFIISILNHAGLGCTNTMMVRSKTQ